MKINIKPKTVVRSFVLSCLILCTILLTFPVSAENSGTVFSKSTHVTNKIAITFDDGPHPVYTERILEILEKYDVKATFFVIGKNVENYPESFEKVCEAGHEIGNHSYSHACESRLGESCLTEELDKCERIILDRAGIKPKLFRPPQGAYNSGVERTAQAKGYSLILWSLDTEDWRHRSPDTIVNNALKCVEGGDIILMHDYISGKNTTCDALEMLIPTLQSRGYEFVTVSELID